MKRASIKDIAKIAGVSVATVSYVLNKKEGSRISESTTKKIFEIAETINYRPNKIAKSLKTNKSKLIGLIVADISNDFYSSIARSIEDEAMKQGYTLLIGSSDENPEKFEKLTRIFSEQQVDGMIVAPVVDSDHIIGKLVEEKYPIVTVDRYLKNISIPGVSINNAEISAYICEFLIEKNFERIIYVGYETKLVHLLDRQSGFDEKLSSSSLEYENVLIGIHNISEEVDQALSEILKNNAKRTAICFSCNKLAVAGLSYLNKNNIKVPQGVSVIAFDETEAYKLFPTEVDYVEQPLEKMAQESMKLLDAQINNYIPDRGRISFSAKLINKNSVK